MKRYKETLSGIQHLLKEWNYERNLGLAPEKITIGSGRKVWWKCSKNQSHEWEAVISSRTRRGSGCPYCAGQRATSTNNLEILNPELTSEWDFDKNKNLNPCDVLPNSNKKVWWKCKKGHESWKTSVNHRSNGTGCPKCKSSLQTSFEEQTMYFYLKRVFPSSQNRYKVTHKNKQYEIDVYIQDLKLGIEYDGIFHGLDPEKNVKRDEEKNNVLNEKNIFLIRVRDSRLPEIDMDKGSLIEYTDSKIQSLKQCLIIIKDIIVNKYTITDKQRVLLNEIEQIDIEKDKIEIMSFYKNNEVKNSLLILHPEIAKEWHPKKNNNLKPESFRSGSQFKAWWLCDKKHEYQSTIVQKVSKKTGCPYCAGQRATEENNFKNKYPAIAEEWDYEKNGNLLPENVMPYSNKKVWWQCNFNDQHQWLQSIPNRIKGVGCPYCYQRKPNKHKGKNKTLVITWEQSLKFLNPSLANEWHPSKNGNLTTDKVTLHSNKKVWWQCSKNNEHEWEAMINNRSKGHTCPYCSGKKADKVNNLGNLFPNVLSEWDYEKNGLLTPYELTVSSSVKVWWKCEKGHSWNVSVNSRRDKGKFKGCPYCSGFKTDKNKSIVITHPEILLNWDVKSNIIDPSGLSFGSEKKVNWCCKECNHKWNQMVASRIKSVYLCPKCKKEK